jgi:primosomal replication protein N
LLPGVTKENHVELTAGIEEQKAIRYTPAGLPVIDLILVHSSSIQEAGTLRQVNATVKAVAIGSVAEQIQTQPIGSVWKFSGFLATPKNGKNVILHIQEFKTL